MRVTARKWSPDPSTGETRHILEVHMSLSEARGLKDGQGWRTIARAAEDAFEEHLKTGYKAARQCGDS